MNNELLIGKNSQVMLENEEILLTRKPDYASLNTIPKIYKNAISLGSIFLLNKSYIDIQPFILSHTPPHLLYLSRTSVFYTFIIFVFFLSVYFLSIHLRNYFHLYWKLEYFSAKISRCLA